MRIPAFAAVPAARLALTAAALVTLSIPAAAQLALPRISPDAKITQTVGLTDLTVTYSRPGVKGRPIWGALVPYGEPWRTGANNATTFSNSDTIQFGGQTLPPGKYGLATVPTASAWTVIINSQAETWGTNYNDSLDILRVTATPTEAPHQEWLSIGFEDLSPATGNVISDQANLVIHWEKLRVAVPIKVDVTGKALGNSRAAVASAKADDWRTPFNAARYAFQNEVALDEGRTWLEKSLAVEKNYTNLSLHARWQMKDGKKKEAITSAKQAVAAGKASKETVDTSEVEKLIVEWSADPRKKS